MVKAASAPTNGVPGFLLIGRGRSYARVGAMDSGELKRWDRRIRELGRLKVEQVGPPLADELVDELEAVERESWEVGTGGFRVPRRLAAPIPARAVARPMC